MLTQDVEMHSLLERVDLALKSNPHLNGRRLDVRSENGHVVVRGTVASYYQKQMAQETLRRVEGVESIDNQLAVSW